ncbi:sulfite reductase (NADPH) flavoprotein alpha-component [Cohaesibacter marisflavi]|uniref:NADPH--hemoprotein reductase n=1 Tax=Cohaesibacter marisflavi TaxID=655353 RepID=A0A1I5JPE5_9HYPH|nr:PepSY domain-containing protein [Cohaesibacter marisflavi]SFO74694.1 sulfite reductase (NADPH) flavoprotein alpha-component [Cohaesibacter marisflavi]
MQQLIHKITGLFLMPLVLVIAISGSALSIFPVLEQTRQSSDPARNLSVAALADAVKQSHPGTSQIVRHASGQIVAYYFENGNSGADLINPTTGESLGAYQPSQTRIWLTDLHRSLFLGDGGRMTAGLGAAVMLLICVSGLIMLKRRMGDWRQLFGPIRGTLSQRFHLELARMAILGLSLSAVTGLYMTAATFGFAPDGSGSDMAFPAVNGSPPAPIISLEGLQNVPVIQLRELTFPYNGDASDAFTLTTANGSGYVDQATGALLAYTPNSSAKQIYEFIYMLHTGDGLAPLALLLGFASLGVPAMGATGALIWWKKRQSKPRISNNTKSQDADAVVLVGSEGNSTWGFARSLHDGLSRAGLRVHTAKMNDMAKIYPNANQIYVLTATYGDGEAPASANNFMTRLDAYEGNKDVPVAILGFGDKQFSQFCQFAFRVGERFTRNGWHQFMPLATINRQSVQEFNHWNDALSQNLGITLELDPVQIDVKRHKLRLVSRADYGQDVQAPTSVFRFEIANDTKSRISRLMGGSLPAFEPGDLLAITPEGDKVPRYYSLASGRKNGFVEICVRNVPGGLCSEQLHGLKTGDTIEASFQANPGFRLEASKAPVILIGAGAGIAPLVGFIRNNRRKRPMRLYFGARHPRSDFLYRRELGEWHKAGFLHSLKVAFSRAQQRLYVQDRLRQDAAELAALVLDGAQIMVCGGRGMAKGIEETLTDILQTTGIELTDLRKEGRYVEDVF